METLAKRILRRKNEVKRKLTILKFDNLNVMKEMDSLYDGINDDCKKEFRAIYKERYAELWLYLTGKKARESFLDELAEMYLLGLLNEPDEQTHYAFEPELKRKRDRAKEAIDAVPTQTQKQLELEKAIRYVTQQVGFYVDITEDAASLRAMKDAGITKVRWNIYGDDKVCSECRGMDGNIYPIDRVPDKPHLRCRCYLTPIL